MLLKLHKAKTHTKPRQPKPQSQDSQFNPILTINAKTPDQSDYTSIQERIERPRSNGLRPFTEKECNGIPFKLIFVFGCLRSFDLFEKMVGRVGFEPTTNGLKVQCSTN